MLDDEGKEIEAVLLNVLYVRGINRRLFSITKFVSYGHMATFKKNEIVLYFGEDGSSSSLPLNHGESLASKVTTVDNSTTTMAHDNGTPSEPPQGSLVTAVPQTSHTSVKKHISIELLHNRFTHGKCRALLAASQSAVWADALVCMVPEKECESCKISTIRATARNK